MIPSRYIRVSVAIFILAGSFCTTLAMPGESLIEKGARISGRVCGEIHAFILSELAEAGVNFLVGDRLVQELESVKEEMRREVGNSASSNQLVLQEQLEIIDRQLKTLRDIQKRALQPKDLVVIQQQLSKDSAKMRAICDQIGELGDELTVVRNRLEALEHRFFFRPDHKILGVRILPFEVRAKTTPPEFGKTASEYFEAAFSDDDRTRIAHRDRADLEVEGTIVNLAVAERSYRVGKSSSTNILYKLQATVAVRDVAAGRVLLKKTYEVSKVEFLPVGGSRSSTGEANEVATLEVLAKWAAREILNYVFWDPTREELPKTLEQSDVEGTEN